MADNRRVDTSPSLTSTLQERLAQDIAAAGGWIPFDRFMAQALYTPGLGYYANASRKFGALPTSGSDFVTAPELTPLFGRALAAQVAEALAQTRTDAVWEFGAGSGALAAQLLDALGDRVRRYTIVDLSGSLRERQQATLAAHGDRVQWANELPQRLDGVVVGNEVLDAMPVQLLVRHEGVWHERGVALDGSTLAFADRPTALRPPFEVTGPHGYLTEIHPQAEAFIATLADRLGRGAAFFLDYGFPEAEYYHPQRHMGTVMCHHLHQADDNPLDKPGLKDVTAHVNFTGLAVAAQNAGLDVLGYTCQAHFLFNLGLAQRMEAAPLPERVQAARLVNEHEMGELFKVIGLATSDWPAQGFAHGDRTHRL